jgi:hypothetical protein
MRPDDVFDVFAARRCGGVEAGRALVDREDAVRLLVSRRTLDRWLHGVAS